MFKKASERRKEKAKEILDEIKKFAEKENLTFSEALEIYKIVSVEEIMENFPEEIYVRS